MSKKNRDRREANAGIRKAAADPDADRPTDGHFCPTCRCAFPFAPPNLLEALENNHRLAADLARVNRKVDLVAKALLDARTGEEDRAIDRALLILGPALAARRRARVP